jgi:hypothetical protein
LTGGVRHDNVLAVTTNFDNRLNWRNPKLSSRVRVALYLFDEVKEGNRFYKGDMRQALPGIEQIDRRMRELREVGWVIRNYKDSPVLAPNELLLEKVGDQVWTPGYRNLTAGRINNALKRQVFDRDNNRCRVCGVAAGEPYPDRPDLTARLTIGHLVPKGRQGWNDFDNLRAECALCNEPARHLTEAPVDPDLLTARIKALPRRDKVVLAGWMLADRRQFTELEKLWVQYRQLPARQRDQLRAVMSEYIAYSE